MSQPASWSAGAAGIVTAGLVSPVSAADDLNSVVRTLNAVLNPGDARRFEDQARLNYAPMKSAIGTITEPGSKSSEASARNVQP